MKLLDDLQGFHCTLQTVSKHGYIALRVSVAKMCAAFSCVWLDLNTTSLFVTTCDRKTLWATLSEINVLIVINDVMVMRLGGRIWISRTSWTIAAFQPFTWGISVFPLQYIDKEEVVLWMNTVGPYHNRQETYKYFSLPFCAGSKKTISHYHETLGEALQGVELEFSGLDIKFKGIHPIVAPPFTCWAPWTDESRWHYWSCKSSLSLHVHAPRSSTVTNTGIYDPCRRSHADNLLWNRPGQSQTGRLCVCYKESLLVPNVHRRPAHLG